MNSNISPTVAKELEYLINKNLDTSLFPYVKGKSIRIKNMVVRETRFGFLVFDTTEKKEVAKMFCKTSAVALAKSLATGKNNVSTIKDLDHRIQKNYNDALFHKHTMQVTKDEIRYNTAQVRYEIAASRTQAAKNELDRIIYR